MKKAQIMALVGAVEAAVFATDGDPSHPEVQTARQALRVALDELLRERTSHRLTELKTDGVLMGTDFFHSGYVVCDANGKRAIIEMGAVRWLSNEQMHELMHPGDLSIYDQEVVALAKEIFGDAGAHGFLLRTNAYLGGQTPVQAPKERVLNYLLAIQAGVYL